MRSARSGSDWSGERPPPGRDRQSGASAICAALIGIVDGPGRQVDPPPRTGAPRHRDTQILFHPVDARPIPQCPSTKQQPNWGGNVPGQRPHEPQHAVGIPAGARQPVHLGATNLVQVVQREPEGSFQICIEEARPSTPAQDLCQVGNGYIRSFRRHMSRPEHSAQRHLARRDPQLEEGHRPHPHPGNSPGARVPGRVIDGCRRPGEDESTHK